MKVALIGPELEENLGLRYIHAALAQAGHEAAIFDFHAPEQVPAVAAEVLAFQPEIVGLSMVFTARGREFVDLAQALRDAGFAGHITAGGHFASFHAEELLRDAPALDSVLHGEGEEAMTDLAGHLDRPGDVRGMTYRRPDGEIANTAPRPALDDLDGRVWPTRPPTFQAYLGMPIANILSGRGCYADCAFCSISAWHRRTGGKRFRQRSVTDVAAEMASLYHDRGVRIYNFHDDNFFLPGREDNLRRFAELKRELDRRGVGRIAIQVKARPDSVDSETIAALVELGLFRVFLGVESNAVAGLAALGRGIRREQNHAAVDLLKRAGLHVTFNLLMFEPDCTLADLRDNIAFIRRCEDIPLNFCRVEVYGGTAIERRLREQARLIGDYFGYTYRIADARSQLAYEIFRPVFWPRNFEMSGMNHRAMMVDYLLHLLRHFFPREVPKRLIRRAKGAIAELNRSNAALLKEICRFAEVTPRDDRAAVDAFVEEMCDRRARFDTAMSLRTEEVLAEIRAAASGERGGRRHMSRAASAAAAALLIGTLGTHGCEMAPREPVPEKKKPAKEEKAQPAYEAYTAEQTRDIQQQCQNRAEGQALHAMAGKHLKRETQIQVYVEIDADGLIQKARCDFSPADYPDFGLDVQHLFLRSKILRVPRAGSCTMTFQLKPKAPDDRGTHMFERAPAPREPR